MKSPLYGKCDCCGAADGVVYRHLDADITEYFCPPCAQRHAVYTAAYDQLEFMVRDAVEAWLSAWGNLSGVADLDEQLHQIGIKLYEERKAAQEDVQSVLANAAD